MRSTPSNTTSLLTLFGNSTAIRPATPREMRFVIALQKRFSNQLGFLPREALEWYVQAGRLNLALENGEPAGYIVGREALRWNIAIRPITQAAIAFDAQRRHHGLALVADAETAACEAGQVAIQAMCREGIDANDFWKAAGFQLIGSYDPQTSRGRQMNCWRKQLTTAAPPWFFSLPSYAGHKARKVKHV